MAEDTDPILLLKDQVTCPVCLEVYRQPKSLTCHHVLCMECVDGLPVDVVDGEHVILCPVCRDRTELPGDGSTANLRTAFHINNMVELYEKAKKRSIKTKKVESKTSEYPQCPRHHRDMDMFCEQCQLVICAVCGAREHGNHTFDLITDLFSQHQQEISTHLDRVKQQIGSVIDDLDALYVMESEVVQQGDHAKTEIDTLVQDLTEKIQKCGGELKSSVDKMVQDKVSIILEQKGKIEKVFHLLKNCEEQVGKKLQDYAQHQVLYEKSELIEKMKAVSGIIVTGQEALSKDGYIIVPSPDIHKKCSNIGVVSNITLSTKKPLSNVAVAECKGSQIAMVNSKRSFSLRLPTTPNGTTTCYLYNEGGGSIVHCNIQPQQESSNNNRAETVTSRKFWQARKNTQPIEQPETKEPIYNVSYTPTHSGLHHIKLQVGRVEIPCNPSTIHVLPSRQKQVNVIKGFYSPFDMAVTSDNILVVSERSNQTIAIYNKEKITVRFGGWGSRLGQLMNPTGIAITTDNHIIVADCDNHRIQKFTMEGKVVGCTSTSGKGKLEFNGPHDVAVDSRGRVYVSDTYNHRIQVLHANLMFSHAFGSKGSDPGQLDHPYGIAIDSRDTIYVCDSYNSRIQKFLPDGQSFAVFKKGLEPYYMAISAHNVVYVTDATTKQVLVFDSNGGYLGSAGSTGIEPIRVAVGSTGTLYVSNRNNITLF